MWDPERGSREPRMPGTIPNVRILGSSRSRGGYFGPSCRLPVPIITSAGESGGFLDWSFEREAAVLAFVGETDKEVSRKVRERRRSFAYQEWGVNIGPCN